MNYHELTQLTYCVSGLLLWWVPSYIIVFEIGTVIILALQLPWKLVNDFSVISITTNLFSYLTSNVQLSVWWLYWKPHVNTVSFWDIKFQFSQEYNQLTLPLTRDHSSGVNLIIAYTPDIVRSPVLRTSSVDIHTY